MKKKLILVRHATAEDQTLMVRDFHRELIVKGRGDALTVGKWLAGTIEKPDQIVSSSAPRAYQTAVIFAEQMKYEVSDIKQVQALYDGGARAYLAAVNTAAEETQTLMVFGHNPDITYFAEYLCSADIGSMSKSSVVIIEFDNLEWAEISSKTGKLISYTSPRQLRESL